MLRFVVTFLVLVVSGIILGISSSWESVGETNLLISRYLQTVQADWFILFNQIISSFEFLIIASFLPLSLYLYFTQKKKEAVLVFLSALSWFLSRILKNIFAASCPDSSQLELLYLYQSVKDYIYQFFGSVSVLSPDFCYPSGHVFNYTVYFGVLYLISGKIFLRPLSIVVRFISAVLIIFVGLSRLSLGSHWLADVVGGYLFGFAWLLFLYKLFYKRYK